MMVNLWCGEVVLVVDGEWCVMWLMLGVLVELEVVLEVESLIVLVEWFEGGWVWVVDVLVLLVVGLCGGGWEGDVVWLVGVEIVGGLVVVVYVVVVLLVVVFIVLE